MRFIAISLLWLALGINAAHSAEPYQLVPPRAIKGMENTRAAVLLPMTGQYASVGVEMRRSIEFALTGSRNPNIILQFYDSGGTTNKAKEATHRAKAEQASIIIGPLLKEEVEGVRREGGVKVISFTTSADTLSQNIVSIGIMPNDQIERVVNFASARGMKRFAIITPKSESGNIIRNLARTQIKSVGGEIIYDEQFVKNDISKIAERVSNYTSRTKEYEDYTARVDKRLHYLKSLAQDFPDELDKAFDRANYANAKAEISSLERTIENLKRKNFISPPQFDAVFLSGDDMNDVIMLGSMLLYYGVRSEEVRFLGLSQLAHEKVYTERAFRGAWFPLAPSRHQAQFVEAHEKYLGTPPSKLALLAYDAAALVISAAAAGSGLESKAGFSGLSGTFRFKQDGRSERLLEIREITGNRNQTRVISPASAQF